MRTRLRYRGVSYDATAHERTSELPVVHTYRGRSYVAPLRHQVAAVVPQVELLYRGRPYVSHRGQAIAR
jgi:hypothetical protein